jgi:hypothetical protein
MFGVHDDAYDKIDKYKKQISKLKKDLKEKNIQIEQIRHVGDQNTHLLKQLIDAQNLLGECVGFVEPRYPDFGSPALYVKVVEYLNNRTKYD